MMEIERLKVLKVEEDREAARKIARKQGQRVIVDQIAERHHARVREQELKEREQELIKKQVKQAEEDELRALQLKKTQVSHMLRQVEVTNQQNTFIQQKNRQKEIDEDLKIEEYNRQRDRAHMLKLAEEKAVREEKEKELQKLREQQEKAADRQADIDALRAKRAFEAGEREARKKEQLAFEKKQRLLTDLEDARVKQFADREKVLANIAQNEKETFMRILNEQKEAEEKERRINASKARAYNEYSHQLKSQINNKSEIKKQER